MKDKDAPDTADHTVFLIASKREFKLLETQSFHVESW